MDENNNFEFDSDQNNTGSSEQNIEQNTEEKQSFDFGSYSKSGIDIIQDNIYEFEGDNGYSAENQFNRSPYIEKKKKEKKTYGFGSIVLAVILAAVIGAGSSLAVYSGIKYLNDSGAIITTTTDKNTSVENVNINIDEQASSIAQAVSRKCNSSVVGIRTTTSVISFFGDKSEATGEGSGVVFSADGYIITNYHVIKQAITSSIGSKIEVFIDNVNTTSHSAKVVGYNIASDLAVIKIDAKNLKAIEIGNSDNLSVGQYAITIGAPGGLEFMGSVTYGIISGLNRVVSADSNIKLIQTDAAINPGNSGGALLDEAGRLIGINSSKIVSEEFEGMGFAIPVNTVVSICNNIIANKDKSEPYVGITISEKYTADVLQKYGFPKGAVVLSVAEGSTAESCGIEKGDIITKFNGLEITNYDVFYKLLKRCKIGSEASIEIYRAGRYYQAKISIASNSGAN